MDDYIVTTDDNGGVHLNSGIPNRAFQLAATAIGGTSLEGAGQIWYAALTSGDVSPTADFAAFAAATVAAAGEHADAVHGGVAAGGRRAGRSTGTPVEAPASHRSRAGAGRRGPGQALPAASPAATEEGVVSLGDDRRGVRAVAERIDLDAAAAGAAAYRPMPDMYVYTFQVADGDPVRSASRRCRATCTSWRALVLPARDR